MTSSNEFSPKSEDALYVKDQRTQNYHSKPSSTHEKQFRSEESPKKPFKACYKCGKPGHFKRDCRVKVVCHRCGKPGHIKQMLYMKGKVLQPNLGILLNHLSSWPANKCDFSCTSLDYNEEWIVDSGCSHHATGNETLLSDIRPHFQKKVIMTADNSMHPVTKEGDLNDGSVLLKDVYHVPGLEKKTLLLYHK